MMICIKSPTKYNTTMFLVSCPSKLLSSIVVIVVFATTIAVSQQQDDSLQGFLINEKKECKPNKDDRILVEKLKPQIYYFKVGVSGTSAIANNTHKHIFKFGYLNGDFQQAKVELLPTRVITHGFQNAFNGTDNNWIQSLIDNMARSPRTTYNVFVLNWPHDRLSMRGNGITGYGSVAGITKALGSYVGQFLDRMRRTVGLNPTMTHLIGHGLGAHIMGFAGKYFEVNTEWVLGRITGLDPAGPCFNTAVPEERLAIGDADLVEVYHTNSGGFGISAQIGNKDVYVNGGSVQPGCDELDSFCSHQRVLDLYTYNVTDSCQLVAYECDSYNHFVHVNFRERSMKLSFSMDFEYYNDIDTLGSEQKQYYMNTGDPDKEPLCQVHYLVALKFKTKTSRALSTNVTIQLFDHGGLALSSNITMALNYAPSWISRRESYSQLWTGLLTVDAAKTQHRFTKAIVKSGNSVEGPADIELKSMTQGSDNDVEFSSEACPDTIKRTYPYSTWTEDQYERFLDRMKRNKSALWLCSD